MVHIYLILYIYIYIKSKGIYQPENLMSNVYLEIYSFTMGTTTTGVIVAASIRYKVIFTNDT
jgi:hypothetical protein